MKIENLYEDEDLLVVNKPNNILVYPSYYARNIKGPTLIDLIDFGEFKIHTVHRLDYKTSGIVILSKNKASAQSLQEQFANQLIQKEYYAIVRGYTGSEGVIDTPIKNSESKEYKTALTYYKTAQQHEIPIPVQPYSTSRYSLIKLYPKTGRQHQLRKHMNKISHPIIGDHRYGNRHHNKMFVEEFGLSNLFLHARKIVFQHPKRQEEIKIIAPLPDFWFTAYRYLGFNPSLSNNNQNY